jgi:hypothetical protein
MIQGTTPFLLHHDLQNDLPLCSRNSGYVLRGVLITKIWRAMSPVNRLSKGGGHPLLRFNASAA